MQISNTNLGSNELINDLAKKLKKLKKLSLPNNNIHYIDPDIVPKSVQVLDISGNNLKCNCSTVDALRKLRKRIETFDFDTVKGCPVEHF